VTVSNVSSTLGTQATDHRAAFKQTRADFQAIGSALQSGDLASAQQAFAQLQKDNPRLAQALSSASSTSDNPRLADLKSLAGALTSGDVASAQQAFAKLQQDGQAVAGHHHHHHHAEAAATSGTDASGDNDGSTTGSQLNVSA
jgi:hypothetical protein